MSLIVDTTPALAPLSLPRISEAELQRTNTLVGVYRTFPFVWAGKPAVFRLTPPAAASAAAGWVRVRLGDHSLDLGLAALLEPASLGAAFAGIEIAALPEELITGVLEACCEDVIQVLKQHSIELRFEAWHAAPRPAHPQFGWEIDWDGRERFLTGSILAGEEALGYLAGLVHRVKPQPRPGAIVAPVPCTVAVAALQLPLSTLSTLQLGDVVLVSTSKADHLNGHCELWVAGRRVGAARRQESTVKVYRMNASSETKTPAGPSASLRVEELPVQLLFDIGQVEIPVGQLRTLGQGYTFELPTTQEHLVTIRANGREIGHGELVDIGEKVGVRIVCWSMT